MYQFYNPNPYGKRTGDCVIRAICKATGLEWLDVYLGLCIEGAHNGDWGNTNSVWSAYLRKKGFVRQVIPNTCPDCYTVEDFCEDLEKLMNKTDDERVKDEIRRLMERM
jgi:hypothetical protein